MKVLLGIIQFCLIVLLSAGGLAADRESRIKQGEEFYRDGKHYREVYFGDTVYRLPVDEYLMGITPYDRTRDHAAFTFNATLPDVTPASNDPAEAETWGKGTGWHRKIFGLVEYGRNFISQQQMIDFDFADSQKLKALQEQYITSHPETARQDLKYLDEHTYSQLSNGCKKYVGETLAGDVLQICGSNDDLFVVKCRTGESNYEHVPSPGCSVMINIANKVELTYSYGYDYFNEAPSIHHKVLALIASLRMEDAASEGGR